MLPRRLHLNGAGLFLITDDFSGLADQNPLFQQNKGFTLAVLLSCQSWLIFFSAPADQIDTIDSSYKWPHTNGSKGIVASQVRPPSSALFSTFVSSKLLHNIPLCSQYSVAFLIQSSKVLPQAPTKATWLGLSQQCSTTLVPVCPG